MYFGRHNASFLRLLSRVTISTSNDLDEAVAYMKRLACIVVLLASVGSWAETVADPWSVESLESVSQYEQTPDQWLPAESVELALAPPPSLPDPASAVSTSKPWHRITGQARTRYESRQNYDFAYNRPAVDGRADNDDNFLLTRFRLILDLDPHPLISGRVSFQDAREFGSHQIDHDALDRTGTDIFENRTDLHEGWVKLKLGETPWSIQAGRMTLNYGDQRLIGGFEWANTARTFDAARVVYEKEDFTLDLVAANVVVVDSNAWDEENEDDDLLLAYAAFRNLPQGTQDVYLIHRDNDPADKEIYTFGTRIDGRRGAYDWNLEGAWQWGSSADTVPPNRVAGTQLDHKAWAASAELGYTQSSLACQPRLALAYCYASGDDDLLDGENGTFDNLFPTNHLFYGYMDFFAWKNLHNPAVKLHWNAGEKLKLKAHWHFFWLDEPENDAWYNAGSAVLRNAQGADASSYVGQEIDFVASYECSKNLKMEIGYGHFFSGDYLRDTANRESDDADFFYLQTLYTF